jgi:acetyl-CoA acyltransferase
MRPDDLAAHVIAKVVDATPGLRKDEIEDVVLGCAMPEGEQGLNVARVAAIRAGLPTSVPGMTVNRFCSSGLQAIAIAADRIVVGEGDVFVAGGVESMSRVPMMGFRPAPNPVLVEEYPQLYMGMGYTAEEVVRRHEVSRDDQDGFALRSHRRAAAAIDAGKFADEIAPVEVERWSQRDDGGPDKQRFTFAVDEGVRRDTTLEALRGLQPAFHANGSVTAGNSSQMSDGAAAVVVMSASRARELGLEPMAEFRSFAVGGVDPDVMGLGPVCAVPKALKQAGISGAEIGLIELNEAFAAQALEVMRSLEFDPEIVNVNGGAIALGHPLGCTGARQTVTLMHEAARRKVQFGLVTMCIGGGMGAAGVFEFPA